MRIRETTRELSSLKGAVIHTSLRGIREAGSKLASLSMGYDGNTGDGRVHGRANPERFLKPEERREWERLSDSEREEYLRKGREMAEREWGGMAADDGMSGFTEPATSESGIHGLDDTFREHDGTYGDEGEGTYWGTGAKTCKIRESKASPIGNAGRTNDMGTDGGTNNFAGTGNMAYGGMREVSQTAVPAFERTADGAAQGAQAAGDAASGGTTVAVRAAKKAAEAFKEALEEKRLAGDGEEASCMAGNVGQTKGTFAGMASKVAAMAGGMVAAVAAAFAQAAFSAVASLVAILTPVIVAVTTIASVISLVVALLSTPVVTPGGGSAGLVELAVSQEGVTSGSRYWTYTMGSRFVNGSSTPWCACFVSWCANECGYIDDGLFPKSGSVAAYKNFYQSRGLYQSAAGYVPRQGDLIIFGNNSHIGIVQYVEGSRVITIEGNASDAVHTRSYSLTNPRISGYCTPDYPPEDAEDGAETEPGGDPGSNRPGTGRPGETIVWERRAAHAKLKMENEVG